jgi:hypothetical protein
VFTIKNTTEADIIAQFKRGYCEDDEKLEWDNCMINQLRRTVYLSANSSQDMIFYADSNVIQGFENKFMTLEFF